MNERQQFIKDFESCDNMKETVAEMQKVTPDCKEYVAELLKKAEICYENCILVLRHFKFDSPEAKKMLCHAVFRKL